jgi:transposase
MIMMSSVLAWRPTTMEIHEREHGDKQRLEVLIHAEARAKTRDRLRMVLLALRGWEAEQIAAALSSSRRTVQSWVYRYRDGGVEALRESRYNGRTPRLTQQQQEQFKQRMLVGPREADGVCTLRGKDAVAILKGEFGVKYSLNGAYKLLHRLGLSCLAPRPRHEKQDPAAQEKFRNHSAPLFSER